MYNCRFQIDSSYSEVDPEVEENTAPVIVRVKKHKKRHQQKLQNFNVQPVSVELKETIDNGVENDLHNMNDLRTQKHNEGNEKELKFVTSYRSTVVSQSDIYRINKNDLIEETFVESKETVKQNDGSDTIDYQPKIYLNNDEINKLNDVKPSEGMHHEANNLYYHERDRNNKAKHFTRTQMVIYQLLLQLLLIVSMAYPVLDKLMALPTSDVFNVVI